jgi:nucleotide-binding universal stress UspA family protein
LYVREKHEQMNKILVCMGGLGYAESVLRLCLYLAKITGAGLTLLHIVEPVTLQYPTSKEVHDHWRNLAETDTPQGKNLRRGLDLAGATGLEVETKIRQGNPVHEIIEEVKTGEYDLVGMGSPHSTHSLRHLYMPNVTAEVAENLHRPVLAVRQEYPLISES